MHRSKSKQLVGSNKMKATEEEDKKEFPHSEDEEHEKGFSDEEDEKPPKRRKQKKQNEEISLVFDPPSLAAAAVCFRGVDEVTAIEFQSSSKQQQYIDLVGNKMDDSGGDKELFGLEINKVYSLQNWVKEFGGISRRVKLPYTLKAWRPTEKYIKGVEAFLLAVSNFFNDHQFHGDLLKEGMILVKELESAKVGNNYPREVIMTIQPSSYSPANEEEIQKLQEQDLDAVVKIVFGLILPNVEEDEESDFYEFDLVQLQSALKRPVAVEVEDGGEAKLVDSPSLRDQLRELWKFGNHTGLWSSTRRRTFLHNVVDHIKTDRITYSNLNLHCLTDIERALDDGMPYGDWHERINTEKAMSELYKSDQGRKKGVEGPRYDGSGSDFTRFCHNFLKHIREWTNEFKSKNRIHRYRRLKRKYVHDKSGWVKHDDYAEVKLSKLFPGYMSYIVASLKQMSRKIEIKS